MTSVARASRIYKKRPNLFQIDDGSSPVLRGITGSLQSLTSTGTTQIPSFGYLTFKLQPILQLQRLEVDSICMKDLVLLSFGFLKFRENQYISLTWTSARGPEPDSESEYSGGPWQERLPYSRPIQPVANGQPNWPAYYHSSKPVERPPYRLKVERDRRSSVAYSMRSLELDRSVTDFIVSLADFADTEFLSLESMDDPATKRAIDGFLGSSYVPADEPWVRVHYQAGNGHENNPEPLRCISRLDAQKLAFAILSLPWHSQSYLIGGNKESVFMQLLQPAARRLQPSLFRTRVNMKFLSLGEQDKQKLSRALEPALSRLASDRESASLTPKPSKLEALYKLDSVLSELGNDKDKRIIDHVVGILMVTNVEFQELLHGSIRNLKETTRSDIQLDLRSTTLKVPSAFGVMQHFPVDMDQILPEEPRGHESIAVSHTAVILAGLRGALRCMMFLSCPDADPLLSLVSNFKDTVYVK